MAAATPANSATTFARSTKKPVIITKNVGRNPNSSRMRSESPLPVTTPMRAHIHSAAAFLALHQTGNDVVHGNGPDRTILLIYDRQHSQIVFVKELEHFLLIGFGGKADYRFHLQGRQALVGRGQEHSHHGNHA